MDDNKEWTQLMIVEQRRRLRGQIGAVIIISVTALFTIVALWCLIEMSTKGV